MNPLLPDPNHRAMNPPLPDTNQGAMNPPFLDSNQGVSFDPIISSGLDMPNMEFMDAQQQLPQHELGFFDNLNMDDQMLQSEFDSW